MSNAAKLADILKRLGDAHYQAADELIGLANEQPAAGAVPPRAPAPADDLPPMVEDYYEDRYEDRPQAALPLSRTARTIDPQRPPEPPGQGEGSLAMCPKHRVPYTEGQYGPYCKQQTDDPAWGKPKGDKLWCRITPKNVDHYLRMQAAA